MRLLKLNDGQIIINPKMLADFMRRHRPNREAINDAAAVIDALLDRHSKLIVLAKRAEAFIAGFEDDDSQEGIADLLQNLRRVISADWEGA